MTPAKPPRAAARRPILFAIALSGLAALLQAGSTPQAPLAISDVGGMASTVAQWDLVRTSETLTFETYARFLLAHPGWPGELKLRGKAERALTVGGAPAFTDPGLVIRYFASFPPQSATATFRYAQALAARGQAENAVSAARAAWRAGFLSATDRAALLGRYGRDLGIADHDARADRLLWSRNTAAAAEQLSLTSARYRPLFAARLAMQNRSPDAATLGAQLGRDANGDPGFVADRASWYRRTNQERMAWASLAQPRRLDRAPADPARWLEVLLAYAQAAAAAGDWQSAYAIASQLDGIYPSVESVRERTLAERDRYTDLAWLAGWTALRRLGRPREAESLFLRYAQSGRTQQVRAKGLYWAGRAAAANGRTGDARRHFETASQMIDQFYGQLAGEQIGRAPAIPAQDTLIPVTAAAQSAYGRDERVRATAYLGRAGRWADQSLMVRTLSAEVWREGRIDEQAMGFGLVLSRQIDRPDLAVMIARNAGDQARLHVRAVYPILPLPANAAGQWTMTHAITRQESQFDQRITSHAGARGLMQLMPGTAREVAGKLGMAYSPEQVFDPSTNLVFGTFYYTQLYNRFGNHALAVAAYNAGGGNVNKWLTANGDPRTGTVDMIEWIEAIPFTETRGYVQRVLENAVIYDQLGPAARPAPMGALSRYLGRSVRAN